MAINNLPKPSTSLNNSTKVSFGETWLTITTTWASETRTWLRTGSLIENLTRGLTDFLWSAARFPWTESSPWTSAGGIYNLPKP